MVRVLVIDDDEAVGALIKDFLEESNTDIGSPELEKLIGAPKKSANNQCGFKVIRKTSGREGIKTLRDSMLSGEKITLAFIDITLSDMNGLEVGYQLGKIDDGLKIVYISGWDLTHVFPNGTRGPLDSGHFIQKPFKADDILQYAKALCGENDKTDTRMAEMHSFLNLNLVKYD
ncbi:MAG: response regulator [Nitrospinota bacterium]